MQDGKTILVVDNEPFVLRFCSQVLANAGYDVLTSRDSEVALEMCKTATKRINLALLDVMMPGMKGPELADCLERQGLAQIVMLMSGYAEGELKRCLGYALPKRLRFLSKPFQAPALLNTVQEILGEPGSSVT